MKCSFYKWYSQALGATLGIIACIFAYLNGYMFVYSNIENNIDYLGFDGILSSYLLLPMCVLTLIFAVIRSYSEDKSYFNISFEGLNKTIAILTIPMGFLGAKAYFILPSILIIIGFISINIHFNNMLEDEAYESKNTSREIHNKLNKKIYLDSEALSSKKSNQSNNIIVKESLDENTYIYKKNDEKSRREAKLLMTRRDMVTDLLAKGAKVEFISEVTGFTLEEIEKIK